MKTQFKGLIKEEKNILAGYYFTVKEIFAPQIFAAMFARL